MPVTLTPDAVELLRRSLEQAKLSPPAGVRLRLAGGELRPRFAQAPEPDDILIEADGVRVFVDPRVPDGEIAVSEEHERLVLR